MVLVVDLTRYIKDGVIKHLSSYPRLNQFLPAANIYAMQVPSNQGYPYLRYSPVTSTPYESLCAVGTVARVDLNIYAEGGEDPGETALLRIKELVVEAMRCGPYTIGAEFLGSRELMVDQEADRWRSILEYRLTAVVRKT